MSEPRTKAGRALLRGTILGRDGTRYAILAIEAEARAQLLREVRERVEALADDGDVGGYESGWHDCRADVLSLLTELEP